MSNFGSKADRALSVEFLSKFPAEASRVIAALNRNEAAEILSGLTKVKLRRIWRQLPTEVADDLLPRLEVKARVKFLKSMDPVECASALNRLSEEQRALCLSSLPASMVRELEALREYPANSAGRIMDSRTRLFRPDETVRHVRDRLRMADDQEIRHLFVVDENQVLQSFVDIQDIAVANSSKTLSELARPVRATTSPFEPREVVAEQLRQLYLEVLPVVDVNQRMLGVIRHSALLRTLQETSAADLQTMVGAGRDERALSKVLFSVRKRLPWMEINLATAFLAAAVVGIFEHTIAQVTALAVLLPVVAGQSGNAGAQALAVTMRGLALREITVRHWAKVVRKEARIGAINGIAIALTTAAGVYVWSSSVGLAVVIGLSMVISMMAAGVAGALVPIVLLRIGLDPAQSASIILTTVTDVAGFLSFLGIATLMLRFL